MKILSTTFNADSALLTLSNGNGGIIGQLLMTDKNTIEKMRSECWTHLEPRTENK